MSVRYPIITASALAAMLLALPAYADNGRAVLNTSHIPKSELQTVAEATSCAEKPLAAVTVATLNRTPIVTLFANSKPVVLLLDTGAISTVLTPDAVKRIGATAPRIEFQRQINGISGTMRTNEVELSNFVLGGLSLAWRRVDVAPIHTPQLFSIPLDGLLGADILSTFDVDLDLNHHAMTLHRKGSCATAPPWTGAYAAIKTGRSPNDHLFFPVQLDGHKVTAIIDSGAQLSVVTTQIARSLGVDDAALASDRAITTRGVTNEQLSSHVHRFKELIVGGEAIRDPNLLVTDARLKDADIVLGADFLSSHRVWLSYDSFRIFLAKQQ